MTSEEQIWLEQARQGDEVAFSRLVEAYQGPVFNLCYRMLDDPMEAEDAAQETFLRAYLAFRRYDPNQRFLNWILTIASNHCIDRLRRRRLLALPLESLGPSFEPADPTPGPLAVSLRAEERREVQQMLQRLPPADRAAIVMLYWHELSYEEIAQSLSITVGALKSRLHRARLKMAQSWSQAEGRDVKVRGGVRDEASAV